MTPAVANNNFKKAQSMIEMLVAIGIAVLVIVALVQVAVTSVKNSQFAKNQNLATRLAQEAIEEVRGQRDKSGWPTFYNTYNATTKCLPSGDASSWTDKLPQGCGNNIGTIFSREVGFTDLANSGSQLLIIVTASWTDTSGFHKSEQATYLTKW